MNREQKLEALQNLQRGNVVRFFDPQAQTQTVFLVGGDLNEKVFALVLPDNGFFIPFRGIEGVKEFLLDLNIAPEMEVIVQVDSSMEPSPILN